MREESQMADTSLVPRIMIAQEIIRLVVTSA